MTISGDRDVRVKIEKDTLDGVITYYDTTLENDGTYDFTLDSCEYNVNTETMIPLSPSACGTRQTAVVPIQKNICRHGSGLYPECGTEPV